MDVAEIARIVIAHGFNVTLTGGDPLQNTNIEGLTELVDLLRAEGLSIWCYTGYTYEELTKRTDLEPLLKKFEAIVDGPYIESERDLTINFRGSRNQRVVRPDGTLLQVDAPIIW